MHLTSSLPDLIGQQPPGIARDQTDSLAMWQQPPATPGAPPLPTVPPAVPPLPPGQARQQAVDPSGQKPRLKAAWTVTGHPNLCVEGSPFCDATQPSNRQAVMSLNTPALLICLSVALRRSCFSGCMRSHAPLSAQDEELVAQLGGLTL